MLEYIIRKLSYALLIAVAIIMAFPFFWMISTALKSKAALYIWPPELFPKEPQWYNFVEAWNTGPFNRYFLNTSLITGAIVVSVLFLSSMGGFAFGKYNFRGKNILFLLILSTMMIPFQVVIIPLYLIIKNFGWLNSYQGLIVPRMVSAFGIFLVRQYLHTVPDELLDAARIDGCTEWRIYWKILLPLIKPVLGTLAIFTFTLMWSDFLWPIIILDSRKMYTLQVGLAFFRGQYEIEYNYLMAASFSSLLPVMVIFIFCQKYLVRGISLTGMKA